jgi:phage protein D
MASTFAYPIPSPRWVLNYQGTNITAEISRMVVGISYVDYLSDLSGEAEVTIEDHERRWQGSWYPALGDRLTLMIGYHGGPLLPCGDFQVDELELSGPPDTFTLRCLAAYITPAMRTANSVGYENRTLLEIAELVASKYGLAIVSAPQAADLTFARVTQKHESDLVFLKRLAREHDYDFTVRGAVMVFYAREALEQAPPVATLMRSDVEGFEFRNRTYRTYHAAQVTYQDPANKSLIARSSTDPQITFGDQLKIATRCENDQQALMKAQAALHSRNMLSTEAIVVAPGSTVFAAGSNLMLTGFGEFDGRYLIRGARHRLDRSSGYRTQMEMRRVA